MIGYGKFHYAVKSRKTIEWPIIGVALQKSYISVYVAVTKARASETLLSRGLLPNARARFAIPLDGQACASGACP
jgi:hypothetical protein